MKKSTQVLTTLLMSVLLVAGCGQKNTTDATTVVTEETVSSTAVEAVSEETSTEEMTSEEALSTEEASTEEAVALPKAEIQVFIAASLSNAMEEIKELYAQKQPDITVTYNADSSGTLLTQIEEGYACDVFFSASTKQIVKLTDENLLLPDTRVDLLKNQVVLITPKGSGTKVTGFDNMDLASSMALADGSVPAGNYARNILMKLGILPETDDTASITTDTISEALGGIEINECSNVSKVKEAVKEGSNEIGCVYYSDAYSIKDDVDIIAEADTDLTGDIIYPVAQVENKEATEDELNAAADFIQFLQTDEAKAVFEKYMFLLNE